MKHGLLALGVLLGGACVVVHAEYVRFVYTPGVVKKQAPDPQAANAGQLPGQGPFGAGAMGTGAMGGRGSPGAMRGGGSAPPMDDEQRGGGMQMQQRGNMMRQRMQQGGMRGNAGIPMMQQGGGPMLPGMAAGNAQQDPEDDFEPNGIRADIVVECSAVKFKPQHTLFHHWGKTLLYWDETIKPYRVMENKKGLPTVALQYETKRKDKGKGKALSAEQLLEMAEFALTHGLQDKFDEDMTELVKSFPKNAHAQVYQAYQKDFKRALSADDPAAAWSARLGNYKPDSSEHYTLLYDASRTNPDDVKDYKKHLESSYKAFYSWFAVKGINVSVPEFRLVVVLSAKPQDFTNLEKVFDPQALPADGFHSRRDNLSVVCATPLDEAYDSLRKSTDDMWISKGWNIDKLLHGDMNRRESNENNRHAQTVALLLKAMQEESELNTASHVGSRQLATASGLLPRTVAAPEWIQFGTGSFFETPREAYWPGTGAPHWTYALKFKIWQEKKKLTESPQDALRKVVTDDYFRSTDSGRNKDALLKARTMAWSLTYFLAQKHLDHLLRYYRELSTLPRDMDLGADALLDVFVRSFDLGSADSNEFRKLAQEWFGFTLDTANGIEVAEAYGVAKEKEEIRIKKLEADAQPKKAENKQALQPGFRTMQPGMQAPRAPGKFGSPPASGN
jgi:Protein of unknown function (DUF1570)